MKSSFTKILCAFLGILTASVNAEYTVSKRVCLYSGYSTYALSNQSDHYPRPETNGPTIASRDCDIITTHYHAATYTPPADRSLITSLIVVVQGIPYDNHTFTQKKIPSSITYSPLTPQLIHGKSLLLFINNLTI